MNQRSADHPTLTNSVVTNSVVLPVEWQAPGRAEESVIAVQAWLEALLAFSAPLGLSFVLRAGGTDRPWGGLVVHALDEATAARSASLFKSAADALNIWQGLGDPVPYRAAEPSPNRFHLVAVEGPGREIFSTRSAPWDLAAKHHHATTMTMELRGSDTANSRPAARCTVSLSGQGPEAEMIATLLAADAPGEVRLESVPSEYGGSPPPELLLPLSMAAHLLSSPARMPEAWPPHPVERPL